MKRIFLFLFSLMFFGSNGFAQQGIVTVHSADEAINVDGDLDEVAWSRTEVASDFQEKYPVDTIASPLKTEVRLLSDKNFLYIGVKLYGYHHHIIQSLKRDGDFFSNDGFAIVLDPNNRKNNGYFFGVNAGDAQTDGLVNNATLNESWDTKWFSAVKNFDGYWTVEIAIPLSDLRYRKDAIEWGINFIRSNVEDNTVSTWMPVPRTRNPYELSYLGKLSWNDAPSVKKLNAVIIPYVTAGADKNYQAEGQAGMYAGAGADAKIGITPTMNLDVTVNPDFSQVEVDDQVTNLDRYSLYFPEKRPFFLENADIFSFGIQPAQPFFSRRIGISDYGTVPLLLGVRLTGNVNDDLRIGVLSVQTGAKYGLPSQNYSIAAFQQKLFGRTNLNGFFTNRQAFDDLSPVKNDYNRATGLEFNYLSQNGNLKIGAWAHTVFNSFKDKDPYFASINEEYYSKRFSVLSYFTKVGTDYTPDIGFVPYIYNYDAVRDTVIRLGYYESWNNITYSIFPTGSTIAEHRFNAVPYIDLFNDGSLYDVGSDFNYSLIFANRSNFLFKFSYLKIGVPFDTYLFDGSPIINAGLYDIQLAQLTYTSNDRKMISWNASVENGSYYDAKRFVYSAGIKLRAQPWGNFSLNVQNNHLVFGEDRPLDFLLISTKVELAFTKDLFWTTYLQYNTQVNDFNVNSRFQWQYRPQSNLYIVYTDDYLPGNFKVKTRSLVLKLDYWFGI